MIPTNKQEGSECGGMRELLSEYIDNSLSARQVWEVEKHLTNCDSCSCEVREMKATVHLLHSAPRFDTSDNFMAALHGRLDTVDPSTSMEMSLWRRLQSWFSGAGASVYCSRVPALSLGFAAVAIALVVTFNHPGQPVNPLPAPAAASDSVHVSIASSANSPFSDPAADNLEFRSGAPASGNAAPF